MSQASTRLAGLGYRPRAWAESVHSKLDGKRNGCIIAHRRAGKTVLALAQLISDLVGCGHRYPQGAFIAPTASQARKVAWPYFVQLLGKLPGVALKEHALEIVFPCVQHPEGVRIILASGEQYDRLRGLYLDAAVVDEMADTPDALIGSVLRPALSDRNGKLICIGTVKGRGPFWQMYQAALRSDDWYGGKFLPDDTGVIPADELEYLRRNMSADEFRQEMLCDPDAAVRGSYYGEEMRKAQDAGRICRVPYDEAFPVTVSLDLGIADSTAAWFSQLPRGGEIRHIGYQEWRSTSFMQILREVNARGYTDIEWIGPHDLRVREFTSGQSRLDAAAEVGVIFQIAPRLPVIDGIEAVRRAMPRMVFDDEETRHGRDSLALYRSEYDEKLRVLSRNPVHDWASHGADAMRALITATSGGQRNLFREMAPIDYSKVTRRASA